MSSDDAMDEEMVFEVDVGSDDEDDVTNFGPADAARLLRYTMPDQLTWSSVRLEEEVPNIAAAAIDSPTQSPESIPANSPPHSTPLKQEDEETRSSKKRHSEPKRAEQSMDEDGQTCTICFEPWTNSSEHRLVSLRCGHLFGRSCITRWLKGQSPRCPQCNARARKSEIRNIYAKAVKVIDSSERDRALEDLQTERELRRKVEMDAARARLQNMLECERLKKELTEATKLLQEYRSGGLQISKKSSSGKLDASVYSFIKSIEICKQAGCRVLDACELLGMILVSQPSTNELFSGHGFRKISTFEMKPSEFVLVHQKPIKDMAFHHHDGLVLTTSLDKTVKITNVLTNSVVQTYPGELDMWSCTWDADDSRYFYGGTRTGGVVLYDIRVTSKSVKELPRFGTNMPVVSLDYLQRLSCSDYSKSGPLVGKLSDCSFYEKYPQCSDYKIVPLPCLGPFFSLSSEPNSGHFLISCRPSSKQPRVSHTVCELIFDQEREDLVCNPIQTVLGGEHQVQLTRTKLLSHPTDPRSLLICAADEDSSSILVWDGCSGKSLDHIKTDSPVLDFAELKINQRSHLFALTDKSLKMYQFKS